MLGCYNKSNTWLNPHAKNRVMILVVSPKDKLSSMSDFTASYFEKVLSKFNCSKRSGCNLKLHSLALGQFLEYFAFLLTM